MADAQGSPSPFPLAKLCALLAVVAMTALPFVSCGIVDFKGHELLRNRPPEITSTDEILKTSDLTGLGGKTEVKATRSEKRESLFTGSDAWLHWVYIAAFALAVAAVLVPAGSRFLAVLGIGGIAAIAAFLIGFDSMLGRESASEKGPKMSLKLEIGAYATLAAFAGIAVAGIRARGRGGAT